MLVGAVSVRVAEYGDSDRGVCILLFFFKHKTAYEGRMSDWSSDVCSSDLEAAIGRPAVEGAGPGLDQGPAGAALRHDERGHTAREIGRASCRERVCQYV